MATGISLTAGMRNNLFALQTTARLMEQTQQRLSTGKKVTSALDNPSAFFTAKGHMERASGLASYKDGMGEAVQAISAASAGIEAVTALIDSAIAVAKDAKEAGAVTGNETQTITLDTVTAGDLITIGDDVYTASAAQNGTGGFLVGSTDAETAMNLAALINQTTESGTDIDASEVNGATISLSVSGDNMVATDVVIAAGDTDVFTESSIANAGSATQEEKDNLVAQYATLMSQIDDLVNDSNYKGTNLLKDASSYNLTVDFTDSNSLLLAGFDASVSGLDLQDAATSSWASAANATTDIGLLESAKDTLTIEASDLSSSLSTIRARQNFTEAMMNTLETGADNLTLADMNEEGANMLMLQTQQALGVNTLSMAAQSAQAVLRLF